MKKANRKLRRRTRTIAKYMLVDFEELLDDSADDLGESRLKELCIRFLFDTSFWSLR